MASIFIVESFHVNIGLGDAAIHVLVETKAGSKIARKVVWIDGGTGGPRPITRFWKTVAFLEQRYRNFQTKPLKFDVIVITHWDLDHDGGFRKWILNEEKALERLLYPKAMTKIIFPGESSKLTTDYISGKFFKLGGKKVATIHTGSTVLGQNFFADNFSTSKFSTCDSLTDLFTLNPPADDTQPAMYCIAIDTNVIKYGNRPDENPAIWPDQITATNQASVAAIIAWKSGRVSHYFAGDIDAGREAQIVDWIQPSLGGARILSIKASHHGSASSNPPVLYETFRPRNIVVSAADSHYHPDWEFVAYLSAYAKLQAALAEDKFHQPPVIFTCYPYWIGRVKPAADTVLPLQYWYNMDTLKGKRAKLIAVARKTFSKLDSPFWLGLDQYVKAAGQSVSQSSVYKKLQALARSEGESLFADNTGLKTYTKKDGLQFILITSSDDPVLDGGASLKADSSVVTEIARKKRIRVDKTFLDHSKPKILSPNSKKGTRTSAATSPRKFTARIMTRSQTREDSKKLPAAQPTASVFLDEDELSEAFASLAFASDDPTSTPTYAFSIISSELDEGAGVTADKQRRLSNTDPLDDFVLDLTSGAIRLSAAPSQTHVSLDQRDSMMQWMSWSIHSKDISLAATDQSVTSIKVTLPNGLVFDTVFAAAALGEDSSKPKILTPGLPPGFDNSLMVLGLSPETSSLTKTPSLSWSVNDVLTFFDSLNVDNTGTSTSTVLHPLVGILFNGIEWNLQLDEESLAGKRNALWFAPLMNYVTTMRLEFALGTTTNTGPLSFLKSFWPSSVTIEVNDCRLIGNHEVHLAQSHADSTTLVSQSKLCLAATISAKVGNGAGPTVVLKVATELTSNGTISLIVQSDGGNDFVAFAEAVVKEICGGTDDISFDSAVPSSIKNAVHFRQLKLVVDETRNLSSANITLEVNTSLGNHADDSNIALLLEANYIRGQGSSGLSLSGGLWFPVENDDDSADWYSPDWETWYHLAPTTPNVASNLALESLLPGNIDASKLPSNIPRIVTVAGFEISFDSIEISATIQSCEAYYHENDDSLPSLNFDEVSVDASYDWSSKRAVVDLEFRISLQGPEDYNVPKPTCTNQLVGMFHYDSGDSTGGAISDKSWSLSASVQELKLGALYEYFAGESRDLLYDILKDINIRDLSISYSKDGTKNVFTATGSLVIADAVLIKMIYMRDSTPSWSFDASVEPSQVIDQPVKLVDIANSLFGNTDALTLGLPDFLANAEILGPNAGSASLKFKVQKHGANGVQLMLSAQIGHIHVVFIQLHNTARSTPQGPGDTVQGPIRYFKLSLAEIKIPSDIPVLSNFQAPFDELGVFWVNADITAEEVTAIKAIQDGKADSGSAAPSGEKENPMASGFHFTLFAAGAMVMDYPIGKARAKDRDPTPSNTSDDVVDAADKKDPPGQPTPIDSQSPKTPVKKSQGPLTINDIRIRYKDNVIAVQMDAVFAIGPLTFALFGFEIGLNMQGGLDITKLKLENIHVDLDGLAASFNKPPLLLEGGLIHKKGQGDIYVGGITIGFTPWLFQAAGFYGKVPKPGSSETFTSAFVYAMLRGPLITLEFATISGITGAFGYNVDVRIPTIAEVYQFPLLNPASESKTIYDTLKELMGPVNNAPAWFTPKKDSMWLAAGLTVTAFEMLSVTAVMIVQWSPQLQFHVLGLGTADIPNPKSPIKFAHIELGFLAAVDVANGLFRVEAQLSPNSYVLHPSCHLSGGFALFYWFKTTSAATAGDFVFTIGGYHSAFQVPVNYPKPPRLAINWSFSDAIAIRGEAYFAITPKACMAGMHISATLTAGPLRAWFDAYADFLVNYAPFKFQATGGISVGVSFDADIWFIHVHIGIEIGATLYLTGPPVAGSVHVDFWIKAFDIQFGDHSKSIDNGRLNVGQFYELVMETKTPGKKSDHLYVCLGGLHSKDSTEQKETDAWTVRGGPFAFGVNSYMAISEASVNGDPVPTPANVDTIYARPMRSQAAVSSKLDVKITISDSHGDDPVPGWRLAGVTKCVPRALWGQYSEGEDPTAGNGGNNNIDSLLNNNLGTSLLMMGIELHAPKTHKSEDQLASFDISKALTQDVSNPNPPPKFPVHPDQSDAWTPVASMPTPEKPDPKPRTPGQPPRDQWEVIEDAWRLADPTAGVAEWADVMGWKDKIQANKPQYLIDNFSNLYLEAPHMCGVAA